MSNPSATRRALLRSGGLVAAASLAGCTSLFGGQTTALVVHNERDSAIEVAVEVTDPNRDAPVLDRTTVSLAAGDQTVVADDLPRARGHQVAVRVGSDGPAETFVAKRAAVYHVYVRASGVELVVGESA